MNIKYLLLVIGFSITSACASNEPSVDADESTAAVAEEAVEEAIVEEAIVEEATETEEIIETEAATSGSGNLVSTCTNGDNVRIITVVYDNDATDTVCEVTYEKSTGIQTLWTANNDRDYCMEQATAFVEKQEGWGWTCSNLE
jgi:sirohydrochlorin ferrochelatase